MSRSPRRFALTALLSLLFFAGCSCSQSVSMPIGPPVATTYPLSENAADALIEVVLDGVVDEWHGVAPIWNEAGVVGQGPSKSGIDIYHVYMTNDSENLYLFFCTRISLQARYDNTPTSGELCDLYFDTDNDPRTGC